MVKNAYFNLPRLFEKAASSGKAFWNNSLISYELSPDEWQWSNYLKESYYALWQSQSFGSVSY